MNNIKTWEAKNRYDMKEKYSAWKIKLEIFAAVQTS